MQNIRTMMKGRVIGAVLAMALLLPTSARAGIITYNSSSSPAILDIGSLTLASGLTDLGPVPWAFPQFNPTLGVLQSVTLNIGASISTFLTVTNNAAVELASSPLNFAETNMKVFLDDPLFQTPGQIINLTSNTFFYTSAGNGGALAAGASRSLTRTGSASFSDIYTAFTDPTLFGEFVGAGDLTFTASTLTSALISVAANGNASAVQVTHALLTGSVTYNYDEFAPPSEVPEPSSMFLLGSGILALGYSIKRRKQS